MTRQQRLEREYLASVAQAASFAEIGQHGERWNAGTDFALMLWATEQMEKEEEKQIKLAGMLDKLPVVDYLH